MEHGEACAVMMPYYGAYYALMLAQKMKKVCEAMGIEGSANAAKGFPEGLLGFNKKPEFALTLKNFENFSKGLIDKAINEASQNRMKIEAMPWPISLERSDQVLRTITEGAYNGSVEEILSL